MTFIIRKIRRRPNGQEVVRDQPVNKTELTVGRATECDIYLPDLTVSLNHATIEAAGNSIRVQATSDRAVKAKGKFGTRFVFPAKDENTIGIGPYQIKIYNEDDSIVVATERTEEKTQMLQPEDEEKIFSLKKAVIGKRSHAWFWALVTVFVAIAAPLYYFYSGRKADVANPIEIRADQELIGTRVDQLWLSGPMSLAHTSLADNCNACHLNAFESVQDVTCLSSGCHDGIRNHAEQDDLWASKLPLSAGEEILRSVAQFTGKNEMACGSCHMEHNGREGIILTSEGTCNDCHADMDTRLTDTDLINVSHFDVDHPNFRPTVITEPHFDNPVTARISLDDNPKSYSGLKFPHDIHLEADGAVAKQAMDLADEWGFDEVLGCEDCHQTNAAGALFLPVNMEQNCGMCHSLAFDQDPETGYIRTLRHGEPQDVIASMQDFYNSSAARLFDESNTGGSTRRRPGDVAQLREDNRLVDSLLFASDRARQRVAEIFNEGGACYDCHVIVEPEDGDPLKYDISHVSLEEQFMPKTVFHHESHDFMNCLDCHEAETSDSATDVLLPGIDNCLDCHRGETTVNFIPSNCLMCHDYHDDTHQPFMTPDDSSRTRHASVWPKRDDEISVAGSSLPQAVTVTVDATNILQDQ